MEQIKKRQCSDYLHVVLSPRECPPMEPLRDYLCNKSVYYLISKEYGSNGHAHIEAFFRLRKPMRPDNFKTNVLKKIYQFSREEWRNVKVKINYIDSDPKYGYGYAWKESPEEYYTNLSVEYLDQCLEYYNEQKSRVDKIKKDISKNTGQITIDRVFSDLLTYLSTTPLVKSENDTRPIIDQYLDNDGKERQFSRIFHRFYIELPYCIPHSVYQKINQKTMVFHAHQEIMRLQKKDSSS